MLLPQKTRQRIILNVLSLTAYGCDWRCFLSTCWQRRCWTVTPWISQHLHRKSPIVAYSFLKSVLYEIWSCSKSTLGRRTSALVSCSSADVTQVFFRRRPTGDHASLTRAVLIVKYSRAEQAFLSHFKRMIQSPLQISKDCRDFENLKPCGSNAFFSIYNEDGCKEMIFCPFTNIQALDPLNEIFCFSLLTYGFEEL